MKKSGVTKANLIQEDYDWVRKQIGYGYPPGISRKQLFEISVKESRRLGNRPRFEKPPGRDKIIQILEAGKEIDWTYQKSSGGRGNRSKILPKKMDPSVLLEKTVNVLAFGELSAAVRELKLKPKFGKSDFFKFVRIRNELLAYPMHVYYGKTERGLNKDIMFNSLIVSVKKQIELIKIIEKFQTSKDKKFPEIIKNIDRLAGSDVIKIPVLGTSTVDESYKSARNALRRLLKGKKP